MEAPKIELAKRHHDNMIRAKVLDRWKNDLEARKKAQYKLRQELEREIRELKRRCEIIIDRIDPTLRTWFAVENGYKGANFNPAEPWMQPLPLKTDEDEYLLCKLLFQEFTYTKTDLR